MFQNVYVIDMSKTHKCAYFSSGECVFILIPFAFFYCDSFAQVIRLVGMSR